MVSSNNGCVDRHCILNGGTSLVPPVGGLAGISQTVSIGQLDERMGALQWMMMPCICIYSNSSAGRCSSRVKEYCWFAGQSRHAVAAFTA